MQDRPVDRQINDVVGHAVLQLFNSLNLPCPVRKVAFDRSAVLNGSFA